MPKREYWGEWQTDNKGKYRVRYKVMKQVKFPKYYTHGELIKVDQLEVMGVQRCNI